MTPPPPGGAPGGGRPATEWLHNFNNGSQLTPRLRQCVHRDNLPGGLAGADSFPEVRVGGVVCYLCSKKDGQRRTGQIGYASTMSSRYPLLMGSRANFRSSTFLRLSSMYKSTIRSWPPLNVGGIQMVHQWQPEQKKIG